MILSGTVPVLSAITPDQVTAIVDMSGRAPGNYEMDVTVRAPANVTVQSVQPARATVTITQR